MPSKPKAKKRQSGSIIVSRKSLQKYKKKYIKNSQTAKNSKVIPRGTGSSPLTRFKRELFAFPLQLNLCYQICNKVKACTSLHIWCSTGICMFAKNYGKSEQSSFTSFQRVMYSSLWEISALTCLGGIGKQRGCLR